MRRLVMCLAILGLAGQAPAQPAAGVVTKERPNILLIVADDPGSRTSAVTGPR